MYRPTPDRFLGYPRYVNTSLSVALPLSRRLSPIRTSRTPGESARDGGARARARAVKEIVSRDARSSLFFFPPWIETHRKIGDHVSPRRAAPSKSADPGWTRSGPGLPRVVTLSPPRAVVVGVVVVVATAVVAFAGCDGPFARVSDASWWCVLLLRESATADTGVHTTAT